MATYNPGDLMVLSSNGTSSTLVAVHDPDAKQSQYVEENSIAMYLGLCPAKLSPHPQNWMKVLLDSGQVRLVHVSYARPLTTFNKE